MKAIFFSPFSNIWDHTFPEAMIAEALYNDGVEVITVRCDGIFNNFCVAMSASGLTDFSKNRQKTQVCNACKKRRNLLSSSFPFSSINIEDFLSEEDYTEAEKFALDATPENWFTLDFRGRPIGKYAAYEFLLNFKIMGTEIPPALFPKYLEHLKYAVLSNLASQKIMESVQPDVVLTYNRLYGVNHAFLDAAEQRDIVTYTLQGGGHVTHRAETMTIFKNSETQFQILDSQEWADFSSMPINDAQIDLVTSHIYGLMEGSSAFAYSSAFGGNAPENLRLKFGLSPEKPILLIPLSSEDELNAALLADLIPDTSNRIDLFNDQLDWLKFVIDYAQETPQYQFILRMHPRMYPNKRESVTAPMLERVQHIISSVPQNVIINTPEDDVSIYDLLQITNLVLGYRSTVGAEFAAFGIPVVSPANQYFYTYPRELHKVSETIENYKATIKQSLDSGWSIEQSRIAFRWFAFLFSRICIDLSGAVKSKPSSLRPKTPGLRLKIWRKIVFLIIQFGPLIREKIAVNNRSLDASAVAIINDVIKNSRTSTAVSIRWNSTSSSIQEETIRIKEFYEGLLQGPWKEIADENSLAMRIKEFLKNG